MDILLKCHKEGLQSTFHIMKRVRITRLDLERLHFAQQCFYSCKKVLPSLHQCPPTHTITLNKRCTKNVFSTPAAASILSSL